MKKIIAVSLILIVLAIAGCTSQKVFSDELLGGREVVVYKSSGCGCCGIYGNYMKGNIQSTKVVDVPDMNEIKSKFKINPEMQSCHTTMMGEYFVEGHIPAEAIEKLLTEKPDIAGIAMPGMPSGSPGMPGAKTEPFVIYAVGKDSSITEFMRL